MLVWVYLSLNHLQVTVGCYACPRIVALRWLCDALLCVPSSWRVVRLGVYYAGGVRQAARVLCGEKKEAINDRC